MITRDNFPELPVLISVQTNTMIYAAVEFWHRFGAKRVIMSREVTLAEVREIRQRCPEMEIEVFVHSSICIAHSGRCFMSNYFGNSDANHGACNNACRDPYRIYLKNPQKEDAAMIARTYRRQHSSRCLMSYLRYGPRDASIIFRDLGLFLGVARSMHD